jgi:Protein of unknown function (DUF4031)
VTVYVDDMYLYPLGQFGRMKMSHMMADTTEELLAMADKIGVARRWVQHAGTPKEHFDIAKSKREEAIALGAIPMTVKELSEWRIARRRRAYANTASEGSK